jgi:hypothetical protein
LDYEAAKSEATVAAAARESGRPIERWALFLDFTAAGGLIYDLMANI